LDRVAPSAARRLGLCLDRVSDHEVPSVNQVLLDAFGPTSLDAQVLREVVAFGALRLGMTRLAELLLLSGVCAVAANEALVMAQEGPRERLLQIGACMTGRAFTDFPLRLVLVAGETRGHRRHAGASRPHHPRVARHALSLDRVHREM